MAREGEGLQRAGYRCTFVEPPPSVLVQSECPICSGVLRDPHLTNCCGTSFCRTCIEGVRRDQRACPIPTCQKPAFAMMQDKRVEKALRDRIVACENHASGCEWRGTLGSLDTHLEKSCLFITVTCKHNGCSTRGLRKEVSAHEGRCGHRPSCCEYCKQYESSFDGVSEHWRTCPKCPSAQCPNQIAEALSRAESQFECKLLARVAGLETKIGELETKMADHAQMRATIDQRMALEAKMSDQKQMLSEAQNTQLKQLLEEKLCEQRHKLETVFMEQKEQHETYAAELRVRMEADIEAERKKAFEDLGIKMDKFKEEMKKDIEKHVLVMAEMNRSALISLLFKVTLLPVPPLKMEHAQHKFTKVGKSDLSKQTFYSHIGGFKLHARLEVDDVNEKGDFFSKYNVHVQVMPGEFDDYLQWPFEGTLVLTVKKKDANPEEHFIDFRGAPMECKSRAVPSADKKQCKAKAQAIITVPHPGPLLEFTIQNVKFD